MQTGNGAPQPPQNGAEKLRLNGQCAENPLMCRVLVYVAEKMAHGRNEA